MRKFVAITSFFQKLEQKGSRGLRPLVCFYVLATIAGLGIRSMFAQELRSTEVRLYFMDADGLKLAVEKRTITQFDNTIEQVKLVLTELIRGPMTKLLPTIPPETGVKEVFIDEKGCAYIDFSPALSQNHPGGTTGELATISSIVNTLATNFPAEIRKVRILIGGKEAKTIAGHIDISRPIFPFRLE